MPSRISSQSAIERVGPTTTLNTSNVYCVIGSGPAGISGAAALIAAGCRVTLIDVGLTLEPEREARRRAMASREPEQWTEEEISASRTPVGPDGDVAAKLVHGSDYVYRPAAGRIAVAYGDLGVRASFAQGGLSNAWGAALLPFRQQDMRGWPVTAAELTDAHAAVLRMLPVAGQPDNLMRLFPLPVAAALAHKRCKQIERLMCNLERSKTTLARENIDFGLARLAVWVAGKSEAGPCNYCGRCLHGCPRDLIYSSRHTLRELQATGQLTYVRGFNVDRIVEQSGGVNVHATGADGPRHFEASRVFLAAGVIHSTAILLRSLDWYDRPVTIADSQYYVFPLLQAAASPNVARERLHTLAQVFLEITDESISPYTVHLQVYGYNDLLLEMLRQKLGRFWRYVPRNVLLGRLLLVQGFLHSEHSGHIMATLRRAGDGDTLDLVGVANPDAKERISRVMRKLRRLSPAMRAFPISALLRMTEPGRSFHLGGSFPMATRPQRGQSDALGRPHGWHRTHVIDAAVLPCVPATTMTQTVMANAYRIAAHVARAEPMQG
jgi:choline dehydrogenase-like flavoprotein